MQFHRRNFLKASAAIALANFWSLSHSPSSLTWAQGNAPHPDPAFGPLRSSANILDLPPGFTCHIVEKFRDPMNDGLKVPGLPDGMGAFAGPDGTTILMRNHEVSQADFYHGPYGLKLFGKRPHRYDKTCFGGVSRVVLDGKTNKKISSNLVLEGSLRNCSGGISPWGWLSCEEATDKNHGYVFLCPTDASEAVAPQRIDGYGRYRHEAVAIDPKNHVAYLTEDEDDSCLYRFVPHHRDRPFEGKLQAMVISGVPKKNLAQNLKVGDAFAVEWIDLENLHPEEDVLRVEAQSKGAAIIARGEGVAFDQFDQTVSKILICSTSGGPVAGGQIFQYTSHSLEKGEMKLICQSENRESLDMPDNITVSPWGWPFMVEDGDGTSHIRVLSPQGKIIDFARNSRKTGEMAGICFSPDAKALFVNIQNEGLTVCVQGPFEQWHKI